MSKYGVQIRVINHCIEECVFKLFAVINANIILTHRLVYHARYVPTYNKSHTLTAES